MSTISRFSQKPTKRTIASAPLPHHVAFNHSMIAQAARVPRLAGLSVTRTGIGAPPSVKGRR